MTFRVTILGSSAAMPTATAHPPAHALNVHEQFFLVDCGEGTQLRLMQCGISPHKINAVFITHLHGDHCFGLPGLISTLGLLGRKTPLRVFAPPPAGELLRRHLEFFDAGLPYPVQVTEVNPTAHALVFENKVMEVWTLPLRHRVPCCGYLFREKEPGLNIRKEAIARYGLGIAQIAAAKRGEDIILEQGQVEALSSGSQSESRSGRPGIEDAAPPAAASNIRIPNAELTYRPYRPRAYAYCSDTLPSGKVAALVQGVDLLYHEATFLHIDKALAAATGHSTAAQAAGVALKAGARRLLIGHCSQRYHGTDALVAEARATFPATGHADEGHSYDIPAEKP